MANLDVTFTDDIPKIEREGFTRESKYTPLLDEVVKRTPKAARLVVETQGQASSRASSIKDAAEKHPAQVNGEGLFEVATRSGDGDSEFYVYVKFVAGATQETEGEATEESAPKAKRARKARKAS